MKTRIYAAPAVKGLKHTFKPNYEVVLPIVPIVPILRRRTLKSLTRKDSMLWGTSVTER